METYNSSIIKAELVTLNNWDYHENAIIKQFEFKNFTQALAFIVQVGFLAEKQNHHPELLNVYNKVTLRLNTHTENAVTRKDIDLAKAIDEL